MNIFFLDRNTATCARYHCDKHVVKMILESAQLLCTAHRLIDGVLYTGKTKTGRNMKRWLLSDRRENVLYKASHVNHPSAIWVRQNSLHYDWLRELMGSLLREYSYRYDKTHKCAEIYRELQIKPNGIATVEWQDPPQAMPDDAKVSGDSVLAYRNYYCMHKRRMAKWKYRDTPDWYK
jgi:hypothetical protein